MQLERQKQVSSLLKIITEQLDLPKEEFALATRLYDDLSQWIKSDSQTRFQSDSLIYPFGSMSLGTIVKSTKNDNCDLDLIYRRDLAKGSISQVKLMEQIGEQLKAYIHEKSKQFPNLNLHEWEQCWTISYGNVFSLDIVPAIPDESSYLKYTHSSMDGISTTDDAEYHWQYSNPKGFVKWFEEQEQVMLKEAKKSRNFSMDTRAEVEVEEIPQEAISSLKTPLKRAVQIMKRHRDITYQGNDQYKPSSIIITTLAAKAYKNESDIQDALINISKNLNNGFEYDSEGNLAIFEPICIEQAGVTKSNYAKDWKTDEAYEVAFLSWVESFQSAVKSMYNTELEGLDKIASSLSGYFGDSLIQESIKKSGLDLHQTRQRGNLRMASTGLLGTASGVSVKAHTFFGGNDE